MRLCKNIYLTIVAVLLWALPLAAQIHPVTVTHTMVPPYTSRLSDYATALNTKLRLQLLLTDINVANREVALRLSISGNDLEVRSAPVVVGAPMIFLSGGLATQFTNLDLAPYFRLENLQGISPQQYATPLSEGQYSFCWEVYDRITGQAISDTRLGCDTVYLILNDPPILNLPQSGDQLALMDPMNLIFQWTPRHINATNVSYRFELRELWDPHMDPRAAFLASPEYYAQETRATTLLYTMGMPELFPDRTYAWRVRAISTTGIDENAVFKNDGYSEIYHFSASRHCPPPTFALSENVNATTVRIRWQGSLEHTRYHVQYRKAGVADAEWFELSTYNQQAQISNLEAGTTYDFRVGGSCNALTVLDPNFTYGGVAQFSVPLQIGESEYQCGILPEIQITNTDPLEYIGVNETFTAGDFPVTVQSIEGKNGRFTGQGFIVVPYLAYTKIVVEFNGIQINTDYQLIDGEVVTTYDKTWSGVVDIGDGLEAIGGIIKEIVGLFERQQEILDEYSAETDPEKKENLLETYNTTILTINQKIDELKEEELITEEERHRLDEVRDIDKIASTDLTDQEVDNFKKLSNQKANVVNEIAESVEERKDEAFVVQAIDILGADIDFKNTFEDLKKIVEHFQNTLELCQKEGWESFEGKGIVPYCIWKEAEIPQALYYKKVDIPYISGIIDGVYQEIEGLVLLPKMIYDLSEGVNDFIYAYTYAKLLCTPVKTEMNKKRLEGLLAKLEETEKDGSIWGWVNEQWYTAQEYTVSSRQEKCEDAQKLRNEISQLLEYVSEIENIKKALADIEEQLSAYLGVLGSNDNRGRYEHGKITVIVASFFIPVAGQLSKIERVKKILQTLKTFTKTQWDELFTKFDDELGKLADAGSKFDNLVTKLNNLELPNLRGKLDGLDVGAKSRLADDLDGLSDDAIKQLEDNFGLLDEWKQIDELAISAQASRKPNWFQKILDGNEFNNIRSSSYPNNEVYLVNPKDPSRYVRLDSYKHLDEIISRKYTQFTDIQESTGLKYIQELKDKYPPGTKIANVPSNKLGGTNASLENISEINGQMVLEIPVQSNPIPQKILDEARTWSIKIRDVQGKIY